MAISTSHIKANLIKLTAGVFSYDGDQFKCKTDWLPAFYNREHQFLSITIATGTRFHTALKTVDELLQAACPKDAKCQPLLRKYTQKDGETKLTIVPSIRFASFFNGEEKPLTMDDLATMKNIEVRLVFQMGKASLSAKKNFGAYMNVSLVQVRNQKKESTDTLSIFDDE
jgi:hypothetical protein